MSESKPDDAVTTALATRKAKREKGEKSKDLPVGKPEAKLPQGKAGKKKKIDGAALIGIDVAKEDDFSGWYQQVLLKGDMLDYYDVSGCYILKVGFRFPSRLSETYLSSLHHGSFGRRSRHGSTPRSRRWVSRTAHSRCSYQRRCWRKRKITLQASLQKSLGSRRREYHAKL